MSELGPIPAITRCWERVAAVLPPSDPTTSGDPSVNLDTLAAIAHAKWSALTAAEREIEQLRTALHEESGAYTAAERENARLREALRDWLAHIDLPGIPEDEDSSERIANWRRVVAQARAALASLPEPDSAIKIITNRQMMVHLEARRDWRCLWLRKRWVWRPCKGHPPAVADKPDSEPLLPDPNGGEPPTTEELLGLPEPDYCASCGDERCSGYECGGDGARAEPDSEEKT